MNVPVRICRRCRESLDPPPTLAVYVGVALAVLLLAGVVGATFGPVVSLLGLPVLVVALGYTRAVLTARHQRTCRAMLARIPAYSHLLWQFRAARVEFPPFPAD